MGKGRRSEWSGVVADRFEIQRRLGTGGFGDVYAVYDRSRDATVALKVLHQTNPKSLQRFKREFRSLSGLTQKNLVQLYELLRFDDHWFFTMEMVEGQDYLSHVRERNPTGFADTLSLITDSVGFYPSSAEDSEPVPTYDWSDADFDEGTYVNWERLIDSAKQLGSGVSALHEAGKLHCDLKPGNVLVSRKNRVVVLDFGMVSELTPEKKNRKRMYAGTPQYMAPEQAMGDVPIPQSDWYAFGVMLYQAMTGKMPVDAPNPVHILLRKQSAEPPPETSFPTSAPDDLVSLCRDLLIVDPQKRASGPEVLERLGAKMSISAQWRVVTSAQVRRNAPFVGRKSELRLLEQTLSDVREHNKPKVVHISGASGIGKTQLVRQFVTDVAPAYGAKIFNGRCYENETMPFKAIDSLVDQLTEHLAHEEADRIDEFFDGSAQLLTKLFPVLGQLSAFEGFPSSEAVEHSDSRRWAFRSFWHLVRRLADSPLIFFIDDAQWGDGDSGELLNGLLKIDAPLSLMIVTTHRADDRGPFLQMLDQGNDNPIETVELPELTTEESERLAESLTTSVTTAKLIARESRGLPMFIDTLARFGSVVGEGRHTLEDVLRARMQSMTVDARSLLRVIAIAGQPIERRDAREASRIREDEQSIVAMLRNERLIRVNSTPQTQHLEIYHDRIREAIYGDLIPSERADYHERLAKIFARENNVRFELVAHHLLRAEEPEEAAVYFADAARKAVRGFAYERGLEHYQSALQLGSWSDEQRLDLGVQYADLLSLMGRGSAAAEAFLKCGAFTTGVQSTEIRRRAADQLLRSGHIERGISILYDVMSEIGLDVPRSDAALTFQIARLYLTTPKPSRRGPDPRDEVKIDACFSAASLLSTIDVKLGAFFQLLHHHMAIRYGDPLRQSRAYALQSPHLSSEAKTRSKATDAIRKARELADENGFDFYDRSFIDFSAGLGRFMSSDFPGAHELFVQVIEDLGNQSRRPWETEMVKIYDLYCLLVLGKFREYRAHYPSLIEDPMRREDLLQANGGTLWSYVVALMDDEPDGLFDKLEEVWSRWPSKRYHLQHFWHLQAFGNLELYRGNYESAVHRVASSWKALDRAFILRTQLGRIIAHELRARAHIACAVNRRSRTKTVSDGEHIRFATSSIKALRKEQIPYADAFADLLEAQVEQLRDDRTKAIERFASAEAVASRAGFELVATVARIGSSSIEFGGERVVERNLRWFEDQGVRDPMRFVATFLPTLELS